MKVFFASLGCDKNLVDSERMLARLREGGYEVTSEESLADVIVVNTCCFIRDAKEESIQTILEMAEQKKSGRVKALVVAGCLAQRYHEEIREAIPEVDAILGTAGHDAICEVLDEALEGKKKGKNGPAERLPDVNRLPESGAGRAGRVLSTPGHYAYLKIAEGCDKRCAYCVIPSVRGRYRSVPMETLLAEASLLAGQGVKELVLVAQETTLYGTDLYGEKRLPELLRRLCAIDGILWVRVLYCYPEEITDGLIRAMREEEKVCHYLDIPIQHCSDKILRRMGRRTTKEDIVAIVRRLREEIPDIALRTTLITGFPGETLEDHKELGTFVREMKFDRLGVFAFSPEEGTPAARMTGKVPRREKERRRGELMGLQQGIAFHKAASMAGETLPVLIEGSVPGKGIYVGRTYRDAPDVDGVIFVSSKRELLSGDMVRARVTGSRGYDLVGEDVGA